MYNSYYPQQTNPLTARPPVQPTPMGFAGLKGHPVSSLEEVKATSIDFDGSIFYFPDIANKKIYTKVVNLDGTASLNMYELKPIPENPISGDFVTRQEFDQALARISELLSQAKAIPPAPAPSKEPTPSSYKEVF